LWSHFDFHLSCLQLFLQFCSETRCTGLMPSRCTILNFDLHTFTSFCVLV
jgi:hypothetical protein